MKAFNNKILAAVAVTIALSACNTSDKPSASGLLKANFQTEVDGKSTDLYILRNRAGAEVCITNFGGHIASIVVPDRDGKPVDVALGFENVEGYFKTADMGSQVGRYANRIAQGRFTLDGVEYQLPQNNGENCLHGGPKGWNHLVYDVVEADSRHLKLRMDSPDGDMGFPGAVTAFVTFTLTKDNALDILCEATTDAPTVINMTNHTYFNLSGDPSKPVYDETLWLKSSSFTAADKAYIPTGEIRAVEGTPMDFSVEKPIGRDIKDKEYDQTANAGGYDHNWILDNGGDDTIPSAILYSDATGIEMKMYTNEPGVQIYTANFLRRKVSGKGGIAYPRHSGICLETQHYPDSPNHPEWPSTVLRPGEVYRSHCVYAFGIRK